MCGRVSIQFKMKKSKRRVFFLSLLANFSARITRAAGRTCGGSFLFFTHAASYLFRPPHDTPVNYLLTPAVRSLWPRRDLFHPKKPHKK